MDTNSDEGRVALLRRQDSGVRPPSGAERFARSGITVRAESAELSTLLRPGRPHFDAAMGE